MVSLAVQAMIKQAEGGFIAPNATSDWATKPSMHYRDEPVVIDNAGNFLTEARSKAKESATKAEEAKKLLTLRNAGYAGAGLGLLGLGAYGIHKLNQKEY